MQSILAKLSRRIVNRIAIDTGAARRSFDRRAGQVRILTYHGLIPDTLADRPWVPSHYVTVSQFRRQMETLAALGSSIVQPMHAAVAGLQSGQPAGHPAVCLTFDDGMRDNVGLALPILEQHGFQATFFLATSHVDTGELQANDIIRLLRRAAASGRLEGPAAEACYSLLAKIGSPKSTSALACKEDLHAFWAAHRSRVDPEGIEALAMMSWDDARRLREAGMEIGAHTADHVILSQESGPERRRQIESSVRRIEEQLATSNVPFAYPNGLPEDFGAEDLAVLEQMRTPYAVTTVPGWNDMTTPRRRLRRNCIGLHHSDHAFLAAVFGLLDHEPIAT